MQSHEFFSQSIRNALSVLPRDFAASSPVEHGGMAIIGSAACGKSTLLGALGTALASKFREGGSLEGVDVALVAYDCTSKSSFKEVSGLLTALWEASNGARAILVATKCDLSAQRQVSTEEGVQATFDETPTFTPLEFHEVSAVTLAGVDKLVAALLK